MDWGAISGWVKEFGNIISLVLGIFGLGTTSYIAILRRDNKKLIRNEIMLENSIEEKNNQITSLEDTLNNSDTVIANYYEARRVSSGNELSLWGVAPGNRLDDYDNRIKKSIPIMLFANLKGGVAKTTLSANIAAYFAKQKKERVLLIDLDYQGSLSGLCLSQAQLTEFSSLSDQLIDGTADGRMAIEYSKSVGAMAPNLHFIPAFYPLETTEFQIMFKWFLKDTDHDIRYNLASVLLSDEVQKRFDRIILDGPPRMTPALVNALCASTHLFIPTVLDNLSAETVGAFAKKIHDMRGHVLPRLNVAGIIGTMVPSKNLSAKTEDAAKLAEGKAREELGGQGYFMWDAFLVKSTAISNTTDEGIAYLKNSTARNLFDPIGDEIERRTA